MARTQPIFVVAAVMTLFEAAGAVKRDSADHTVVYSSRTLAADAYQWGFEPPNTDDSKTRE